MASASIYIQKKTYKDGTVPVFIRLTIDRRIYLNQICKVPDIYVDRKKKEIRKGQKGYIQLNLLISRTLQEAKEYLIDCEIRKVTPDAAVFFGITDQSGSICAHIRGLAATMKKNPDSYFTGRKYASVANKIEEFGLDTNIRLIDKEWIKRLDAALIGKKNKPVTRRKDMVVVSATINASGIPNPFAGYKKPSGSGTKASLSRVEFEKISSVDLGGERHVYRQAFVFAVMARGMRAFDLLTLKWSAIQGDRLIYTPDKTRKKEKVVDMAISDRMGAILQEMEGRSDYVFPIFKTEPAMAISRPVAYKGRVNRAAFHMNEALKEIRALAGINKHITIHVARHTFAYLADKSGVSLGDIQRTLNHGSIETTSKYLRSMRESDELDKATEGLF